MPLRNFAAVLRSDEPCTFEYRAKEKLFYVADPALGFSRTMSPETMLRSFEQAARAILAYHADQGVPATSCEIMPFRKVG
jgi:hypothetical protein